MSQIRVVLADDHALVRAGFRALLNSTEGIEVVGEASDGREVLGLIRTLEPDVVLLDIAMPSLSGLEAAARIIKEFPRVRVIMLSMYRSEQYVAQALRTGAAGYLLKDAAVAELALAIKAVVRGEVYFSSAISKHVIEGYLSRARPEPDPLEGLTPRQREILQLIAEGHTTKDIATILNVSVKTVESHRAQLMKRLNLHDIAGLVRFAMRVGLVSPEK